MALLSMGSWLETFGQSEQQTINPWRWNYRAWGDIVGQGVSRTKNPTVTHRPNPLMNRAGIRRHVNEV
ncbi:hypothetical protein J2792_003318 [Novosphingobium capsulatum]|uniref:Uncharacterized protein n=1 Tax=Novosphingobium capsulatum TaxID=13688 RepID=A0ABU1MQ11_9SPHN|nr:MULTISPECIES: hypothetical protein [Novosphingobium]MDR6512435.1 hypothetical protein [Novosphingobium capsulatum]WQD93930.1 hypothetical protein U0041_04895 [Novosphingobium capsulatum]